MPACTDRWGRLRAYRRDAGHWRAPAHDWVRRGKVGETTVFGPVGTWVGVRALAGWVGVRASCGVAVAWTWQGHAPICVSIA